MPLRSRYDQLRTWLDRQVGSANTFELEEQPVEEMVAGAEEELNALRRELGLEKSAAQNDSRPRLREAEPAAKRKRAAKQRKRAESSPATAPEDGTVAAPRNRPRAHRQVVGIGLARPSKPCLSALTCLAGNTGRIL